MPSPTPHLGISTASYGARRFADSLAFLDHAHQLGAAGVQTSVRKWEPALARKLRARMEETGLYLEGQISLPKNRLEADTFEDQVGQAKAAGVSIFRTVALSGRRYEAFDDLASFRRFRKQAEESLALVEPILRRHRVTLAVENHKDWRIPKLLEIMTRFSSPVLGVCLDTGNSLSLLEDPMEVVEAYAPHTVTTHFKDMDVRPYADGFLLSEVPLGEGFSTCHASSASAPSTVPGCGTILR